MKIIKLEDLGFDAFFESSRTALGLADDRMARVVAEYKEAYRVQSSAGEFLAKITGKHIFQAEKREDYPAVGDWVAIEETGEERAVIQNILPRKTILKRKSGGKQEVQVIAANVDAAFIVESADRDYNLNRLERYFVLANEGNIRPAVVLNKIDLCSEAEREAMTDQIQRRFPGVDVYLTSTVTGQGLAGLKKAMAKGITYCFLGSSGVGKSSLINKLLGRDAIKIKEISLSSGRGKHVTTGRDMYVLENGAMVVDNPGMREVGIADAGAGLEATFDEIAALAKDCRYADCTHALEPGCAVREAVKNQKLDEKKYLNYIKLKKETRHYAMTEVEKRAKDRRFGRYVKKALDQMKKYDGDS